LTSLSSLVISLESTQNQAVLLGSNVSSVYFALAPVTPAGMMEYYQIFQQWRLPVRNFSVTCAEKVKPLYKVFSNTIAKGRAKT
jgi:hypothetical protein